MKYSAACHSVLTLAQSVSFVVDGNFKFDVPGGGTDSCPEQGVQLRVGGNAGHGERWLTRGHWMLLRSDAGVGSTRNAETCNGHFRSESLWCAGSRDF